MREISEGKTKMENRKTQASVKQVKCLFALKLKTTGVKPTRDEYNVLQNMSSEEADAEIRRLIEVVDKKASEALAVVQELVA